jgi:hypothetical protein
MNGTTEAPAVRDGGSRWRRGRWPALAAVIVVVVAVLVAVALLGDDDGDGGRTASATIPPAAAGTSSPATEAPTASEPAASESTPPVQGGTDGVPPALPAVALDQPVEQADVTGSIVSLQAVDGQATGPGDVAGPALMVTVRLVNGTGGALSLDAVSVNLFSGPDRAPASPLGDQRRVPFTGTLAAGRTAEGVYVFAVPTGDRDRIDVEVGYLPGQPLAVFSDAVR